MMVTWLHHYATHSMTEQETIRHSVQQLQSSQPSTPSALMWPTIGGTQLRNSPLRDTSPAHFLPSSQLVLRIFWDRDRMQSLLATIFNILGRFAKHPRFRFFAFNTEMRLRALQTGRIYVRQHPSDAQLFLDELQDMVGREGEAFSNRVLHYMLPVSVALGSIGSDKAVVSCQW